MYGKGRKLHKTGRKGEIIPEILTEMDLHKIIDHVKPKYKFPIALGFYQCMRISEVLALKPEHILKSQKIIMIKQAKGNKDRNIPISPVLFRGLEKKLPVNVTRRSLQRAMANASKEVLGRSLTFHSLRHSGATFYLHENGWDLISLQRFLGHSRLETTGIYLKTNDKIMQDLMQGTV